MNPRSDQHEIEWIKNLNTLHPNGYNLDAGGRKKFPSKLSRVRRRESHIGRRLTLEHRQAIGHSLKGRKLPGKWYIITDPLGQSQKIRNLKEFCISRSLNYNAARCVLRYRSTGQSKWEWGHWKGWMIQRADDTSEAM